MKRPRLTTRLLTVFLALCGALTAGPAMGQDDRPKGDMLENQKPWFQWMAGTAFLVVILIPVFKDPKRGHN